jgi:GNAT superfamily N-acetyltransferase
VSLDLDLEEPKMNQRTIASVRPGEQDRCVRTLVDAFADDPVARWLFPQSNRYVEHFPRLVNAFAQVAVSRGTAWEIDGFAGTAVWLAPGSEPDEMALAEAVGEGVSVPHQPRVFALLERMAEAHPQGPHWYLPLIGVEPRRRGLGYGSELLAEVARICDREDLPAYLEATSPGNVALYRRHGFRPLGALQVGDSPPLVRMERPPRSVSG